MWKRNEKYFYKFKIMLKYAVSWGNFGHFFILLFRVIENIFGIKFIPTFIENMEFKLH